MADYRKAGVEFSHSACSLCSNGQKLHKAELMISDSERKWGECDWNSSRWEDYYHG